MANLSEPSDVFLLELGKFVHEYAEIEYVMSQLLRVCMDLTAKQAQTFTSGMRVRTIIDHIKRYHEAKGVELNPHLSRAFPKLAEITTIRDKILHFGNRATGDVVTVTEKYRTIEPRAKTWTYSAKDLRLVTEDAYTVRAHLVVYWLDRKFSDTPKNTIRFGSWSASAGRPWQYTPSPPKGTKGKRLKSPQNKQRPPQSSPQ